MSNDKENASDGTHKDATLQALVTKNTYIEETRTTTAVALVDAPPEAPEPPRNINVFDFLVKDGADDEDWESERDDDEDMRPERYRENQAYIENGYAYGSEPVPATLHRFSSHAELRKNKNVETPAAKNGHSRNLSIDSTSAKKSGKRKRGHPEGLDLSKGDVDMTDVPANLHSGLTGGIHRLLSLGRGLPPSPDLSGDANSPQSPLKRSKRDRDSSHRREKKPRRKSDSDRDEKRKKHTSSSKDVVKRDRYGNPVVERRRSRKRSPSPSAPHSSPNTRHKKQLKAIEYPGHSAPVEDMSQALVRIEHAPTTKSVDMFLTCLAKGSETDEGVSLWKALKRWRKDGGSGEKELWKRLKIRANEEGDLVLCV
jgi:cell growth-regulating nucleolar protein